MLPELTKNWKIGILGPWRDFDSKWPAPNGAPASYLSPGWHDKLPQVGKGLNRDGYLGKKGGAGVTKFQRGLGGSNRKNSPADREIGSVPCQIRA